MHYYESVTLRNDRGIVLTAVAHNGNALQHASATLRNDRVICSRAVLQDRRVLKYIPRHLRVSYVRAGPMETRLLFKYMPSPFDLPEDLVEAHIIPQYHRV